MITGHTEQKGFILLEMIVSIAIGAAIMMGTVALISQEYSGTATAKASVTAAREIGNAARWVSQDGMMAESSDIMETAQPVENLTLTWIDRQDFANIPHSSSYYLEGTELRRNCDGNVTTVARDISRVAFSQNGRLLTVSIGCIPRWWKATAVEKTYRIYLRPTEGS
ncbi:type II secretion system protein J [Chloroflexota bacterium]